MKSLIYNHRNCLIIIAVFIISLIVVQPTYAGNTTVTNSVSVSANSSGGKQENHASVTTIVNGKTVESWSASSSDDISYEHTENINENDSSLTTISTTAKTANHETLLALIKQLQVLISLYVKLNQLN